MRRLLGLLLALALLAGLAACGSDDDGADESTTTSGEATTTEVTDTTTEATGGTTDTTEGTEPADTADVRVYFVRDEYVATAGRTVTTPAVGRGAIEALLEGPGDVEQPLGMRSEIPAGTELLELDIADGVATVDLSSEFASGGGSLSMTLRVAQVVFTLTQFDTVERVDFLIEGEEVDGIGGEGLPTSYTGREAFADVTPMILVESPTPGETTDAPFTVSGMSNTFEATVLYEVTDADLTVVDEGFTTATSGTGTWGTFEFEPDLGDATGPMIVRVFAESMEDGSRVNVYEVPITVS